MSHFTDELSFVTFSCGTILLEEVLDDWIQFLEGRPKDIIFAVPPKRFASPVYEELKAKGKIDTIIYLPDKDYEACPMENEAMFQVAEAADTEWLLFARLDTLPYRAAHVSWLDAAMEKVKTAEHLGLTGGFYGHTPYRTLRPAGPGYATSNKFSNNFSIIRRKDWLEIEYETIGREFSGAFYTSKGALMRRFAQEVAIERHMDISGRYMLVRLEDEDWSVFHVNQWDDDLAVIRERYLLRDSIEPFLCRDTTFRNLRFDWEKYYGYPDPSLRQRAYYWLRYYYGCMRMALRR